MAISRSSFDITKFFIALALIYVVLQVGSSLYSQFYGGTQLKLGWAFFLLLLVSAITSTFVLGRKIGNLQKQDIIFIILEFIAIIALFYFMPKIVPEIFSAIR